MKTDDLIDRLAAGNVAVPSHAAARRVALALGGGMAVSLALMLVGWGPNPALAQAAGEPVFWAKLMAPLLMVGAAAPLLMRLGRPGMPTASGWIGWALPVIGLWLLALGTGLLALEDGAAGLQGRTWRTCSQSIALLALPVFGAAIWSLRGLAPVRPGWAGAGAGGLAGAAGAAVYALHCPELSAAFVAVWYGVGMALPVVAGALLGPRLLRW